MGRARNERPDQRGLRPWYVFGFALYVFNICQVGANKRPKGSLPFTVISNRFGPGYLYCAVQKVSGMLVFLIIVEFFYDIGEVFL